MSNWEQTVCLRPDLRVSQRFPRQWHDRPPAGRKPSVEPALELRDRQELLSYAQVMHTACSHAVSRSHRWTEGTSALQLVTCLMQPARVRRDLSAATAWPLCRNPSHLPLLAARGHQV